MRGDDMSGQHTLLWPCVTVWSQLPPTSGHSHVQTLRCKTVFSCHGLCRYSSSAVARNSGTCGQPTSSCARRVKQLWEPSGAGGMWIMWCCTYISITPCPSAWTWEPPCGRTSEVGSQQDSLLYSHRTELVLHPRLEATHGLWQAGAGIVGLDGCTLLVSEPVTVFVIASLILEVWVPVAGLPLRWTRGGGWSAWCGVGFHGSYTAHIVLLQCVPTCISGEAYAPSQWRSRSLSCRPKVRFSFAAPLIFLVIPFYLQSVPVHSANCV
jgi:hypothetical protein